MKLLRIRFTSFFLTLLFGICSYGQSSDGLKIHYSFDNVSGSSVIDGSGNGITGSLKNNAKVESMGSFHVLNLGSSNGYLDMGINAGSQFISSDSYSVSVYYLVESSASLDGNGYFLWSFSTSSSTSATSGKYSAYRLNAQRYATSTGGYQNEIGIETGTESLKGEWVHVAYIQDGSIGSLYINGRLVGSVDNMPLNSTNYGTTAPTHNWLGRPPFSGDNYLNNTKIADFRLYSRALSNDELSILSQGRQSYKYQYEHGSEGDKSQLNSAISEVESLLSGSSISSYLPGSIEDLRSSLAVAKTCLSTISSQAYIDKVLSDLDDAKSLMLASSGLSFDVSCQSDSYDTDRGFRHPGGLHTEADFDRIKSQLAAGNEKVTQAWNVLLSSEYSQSGIATWPTETIWRSGSGDNYLNVARGAHMAYQNALRWKIAGTRANADAAVRILMAWANGNKYVSGNTNMSLASGLYGYELAQAAELMRDYDGWSRDDFEKFKSYMKRVWYPVCIDFLRRRHDTWLNPGQVNGQRPGHYWSNWGLCNALAVVSMGVLLDDVYMYNQGLSYYKYDQVGNWAESNGSEVGNYGLTEYLGNLVPSASPDSRGAYGKLGQMQESGRDQGHTMMALGLAVDICQTAWNQGDDLFSYMDNRLAAGIEGVAAYNFGNLDDVPWTNYRYADRGTAWHNAWVQTGPNEGSRSQVRAYWARIVGHYEGVKGISMPYSEIGLTNMGIDDGGHGSTSGDYDHLGYSVLTCTYDGMASNSSKPTLLTPSITFNGSTIYHNELGGLQNTFEINTNTGISPGSVLTLTPILPSGESDTGQWVWNTGETTKSITVTANGSYVYRVTYTNHYGVKSEQVFTIYVQGDSSPSEVSGYALVDGINVVDINNIEVFYGTEVTLGINGVGGYGRFMWDNGIESQTRILTVVSDRVVTGAFIDQAGRYNPITFSIKVKTIEPRVIVDGKTYDNTSEITVEKGSTVVLSPNVQGGYTSPTYSWSDGSSGAILTINNIASDCTYTLTFSSIEATFQQTYNIHVVDINGYDITNAYAPWLSTWNLSEWENSGFVVNTQNGGAPYSNGDALIAFPFFEKWVNGGSIGSTSLRQTISELPNGTYYIGGSFIATNQSDQSVNVDGVIFFANDQSTPLSTSNATPVVQRLKVTVSDHTLTYGVRSTSETNANWLALDNLFLEYAGTESEYLSLASADYPIRMNLSNPRMEGNLNGWTEGYPDGKPDNGYWAINNWNARNNFNLDYIECWVNANNGTLPNQSLSQHLTLPAGSYKFQAAVNAVNQNNSLATTSGVDLFLGESSTSCSTTDGSPEIFSVSTTLAKGSHDLGLSLTNTSANWVAWDNTVLYYYGEVEEDAYHLALRLCRKSADDNESSVDGAAKSALRDYEWTDSELSTKSETEIETAIRVLTNGMVISNSSQNGSSLIVNGDLHNGTIVNFAPYGWTTALRNTNGGNDVWVREQNGSQVYNFWFAAINDVEINQVISDLPNGVYRFSVDLGTENFEEAADLVGFAIGSRVGATEQVHTYNTGSIRDFDTYSCAVEVTNHQLTIGVRSPGHYFQMKNVKIEFISGTSAVEETDASYLRQDYFWSLRDNSEVDYTTSSAITEYGNAVGVRIYPRNKNQIIYASSSDQFSSEQVNVVAEGVCNNLVITDGSALSILNRAFTSNACIYLRPMGEETDWGTLIMPFPLESNDDIQYYRLESVVEGENSWMNFTSVDKVEANTPVVFIKKVSGSTNVTATGSGEVQMTNSIQGQEGSVTAGWSLEGVYSSTSLPSSSLDGSVYYIAQNKFWKANSSTGLTIPAFRAYFHGMDVNSVKSLSLRVVDGEATSLLDIDSGQILHGDVYNLNGQLIRKSSDGLNGLPCGIYIVGEKKILVR